MMFATMENMVRDYDRTTFYCFSPPVMLFTFVVEAVLALRTFIFYRTSTVGRLSVAILVCLALFQGVEYRTCVDMPTLLLSRTGLAVISLLPPLGFHLVSALTGKRSGTLLGYAAGAAFFLTFLTGQHAVHQGVCEGNYVILPTENGLGPAFGMFYAVFVIGALWKLLESIGQTKKSATKQLYLWMAGGYLTFMLPMLITYIVSVAAREAVPSVMCGFALLLAIILSWRVVPLYHRLTRLSVTRPDWWVRLTEKLTM